MSDNDKTQAQIARVLKVDPRVSALIRLQVLGEALTEAVEDLRAAAKRLKPKR